MITATGAVAEINPLRYRGYYYDTDTGFYYLQSRYYDPMLGRFLNADGYMSTGQGVQGNNMFAYCLNAPVFRVDIAGKLSFTCDLDNDYDISPDLDSRGGGGYTWGSLLRSSASAVRVANALMSGGKPSGIEISATYAFGGYPVSQNSGTQCFVAGTLIKTDGADTPIEDIEVGDYVWAWDEETGEVALKKVVDTYVNESHELIHVFVNGEEIITTPTHPFYSPVKGWTDAVHLRAGDILVLVNGEYVIVEKVQHEILEAPVAVYNFQVEDYHTYYVTNIGVLVHNRCGGETDATRRGRQMHENWDYGPNVLKEETIGPGARVDGIDYINKIVYELKPNNPRAIQRGLKQLDRYLDILGPEDWAGVLVLY